MQGGCASVQVRATVSFVDRWSCVGLERGASWFRRGGRHRSAFRVARFLFLVPALIVLVTGCFDKPELSEPPMVLPLIRGETRNVGVFFRVPEEGHYAVTLAFRYPKGDDQMRGRILGLAVGDGSAYPKALGRPLPVNVELLQSDVERFRQVLDRTVESEHLSISTWESGALVKQLLRVKLMPGEYKLLANVASLDASFRDVEVDLRFVRSYSE